MSFASAAADGGHKSAGVLRYFWQCEITVCIPAYEAARFIDRTLRCAQGQTFDRLRIVVSIDRTSDDTAAICRRFAQTDRRIEIIEHQERLGWCGNVNALLAKVQTPFFFIYFHDDFILPQYCERLRGALQRSPAAASGHCDVAILGESETFLMARAYEGSVAERMIALWTLPRRGAPLRSMVRTSMVGDDYRLPVSRIDDFTPGEALLMQLMAAGPAVALAETLYVRWKRKDGLTDGWLRLPFEAILDGWRRHLLAAYAIIDAKVADDDDRAALRYSLFLWVMGRIALKCRADGRPLPEPRQLHRDGADLASLPDFERFGPEIAGAVRKLHGEVTAAVAELA